MVHSQGLIQDLGQSCSQGWYTYPGLGMRVDTKIKLGVMNQSWLQG